MPAFVRRYPFVHDGAGPRPSQVLIDAACAGFEQADGELLVEANGEPAP